MSSMLCLGLPWLFWLNTQAVWGLWFTSYKIGSHFEAKLNSNGPLECQSPEISSGNYVLCGVNLVDRLIESEHLNPTT